MKKYEFTGEAKQVNFEGKTTILHRIRAIKDFGDVKAGDLGGWIEKEENLSHESKAWVGGSACVGDNARVRDNAWVGNNACVRGDAWVGGSAYIGGDAYVGGDAWVGDNARVRGDACVGGNARVRGKACVGGNAHVGGNAWVGGSARVGNNACVRGNACVRDNAEILSILHILTIGAIGSRNDFTTFYRDKDNQISVSCGCFTGKIEEFLEEVTRTHRDSKHAQVYRAAVEVAKLQIELN